MSTQTMTIHPWNPTNHHIGTKEIESIFQQMGITSKIHIGDISLYQRAFVHSSYVESTANQALSNHKKVAFSQCPSDCLPFQDQSYENLEFLGDRVIELAVVWYLYERFPT